MSRKRFELHELLLSLGTPNVYFQPPEGIKINYPAVVYSRSPADTSFADDLPYLVTRRYQVTVIDEDPDSEIVDKAFSLPATIHSRHYTADGLNHDVFEIYY